MHLSVKCLPQTSVSDVHAQKLLGNRSQSLSSSLSCVLSGALSCVLSCVYQTMIFPLFFVVTVIFFLQISIYNAMQNKQLCWTHQTRTPPLGSMLAGRLSPPPTERRNLIIEQILFGLQCDQCGKEL